MLNSCSALAKSFPDALHQYQTTSSVMSSGGLGATTANNRGLVPRRSSGFDDTYASSPTKTARSSLMITSVPKSEGQTSADSPSGPRWLREIRAMMESFGDTFG